MPERVDPRSYDKDACKQSQNEPPTNSDVVRCTSSDPTVACRCNIVQEKFLGCELSSNSTSLRQMLLGLDQAIDANFFIVMVLWWTSLRLDVQTN